MLLKKIKAIITNLKNNKIQEGYIVWAHRYQSEVEKETIKEYHQEGPYVIIYKTWFKTYALYCTSSFKNFHYQNSYLEIDGQKYNLDKTTYALPYYIKVIKKNQIIKQLNKLKVEDLNYLKKLVYITLKNNKKPLIKRNKIKFIIQAGDIIYYQDKYYYIYFKDDYYYYLNKVFKVSDMKDKRTIKVGTYKYTFDFNNDIKIPIKSKINLVNTINTKKQALFDIYKSEYLHEKEVGITIDRGTLLKYCNRYYFVYGEYQGNYATYKVYLTKSEKEIVSEIKIANKTYYTKFEEAFISKKSKLEVLNIASDEEISMIRSRKKEMKDSKVKVKNKQIYTSIIRGMVIASIDSDLKYIVFKRSYNTLYCVDYYNREQEVIIEITNDFPYIVVDRLTKLEFENLMINMKRLGFINN